MGRHTYFGERSDEEFVAFADKVIATLGASLEGVPKDRVRMHVCWGNYDGRLDCDVEPATILPSLEKAPVGALMLALANPRHAHEVRLLASSSLPADLVSLLVSSTRPRTTSSTPRSSLIEGAAIASQRCFRRKTRTRRTLSRGR